jgi:protocatechuate 3,4-dioxygenase beta subunit
VIAGVSRRNPHEIYAAKDGYGYAGAFQPVFEPEAARGSVAIVLERADRIHLVFAGRVTDGTGKPVAGARVVWSERGADSADSATTGANGEYRLEAHSRSDHNQLSVLEEGHAPAWEANPPRGTPESPGIVDFTLTGGHWIEGVVVDEGDAPLAGALVVVRSKNEKGQIFETPLAPRPTTDAQGRFRFERLPGPQVELQVRGPGATFTEYGGWSLFEEWFAVDQAVKIALRREGVLSLRVADAETGEPIVSFLVRHDGGYHHDWAVGHAVEKEDGRFVLGNLEQGKAYEVKVEAEGPLAARKTGLVATPREEAEEVLFALGRGAALAGVVFDAETGAPVAGATVLHGSSGDDRPGLSWDPSAFSALDNVEQVETGPDGSFAVTEGERPGRLLIRAPGYERAAILPAERERFVSGGVLRIGLRGGASIVGTYYRSREPEPDAEIYLQRIDGETHTFERVRTDAAGRYEWSGLAPGAYKLGAVTATGPVKSLVLERELRLGPREHKTVDLGGDLGPYALSGEVRERGRPVHQVLVKVEARFAWHYRYLEALTDAEGRYRVDGLREGEYEVLVLEWDARSRWVKKMLEVSGDTRQDFAFRDEHRITGRVRFPETASAAGRFTRIHLRARQRTGPGENQDQISGGASAALADGAFAIPGRFRGEYSLALGHEAGGIQVGVGFTPVFALDNLEGDQHLGDVPAPPLGALRVLIELDPPESPWPQSTAILMREENQERWLNSVYLSGRESARLVEPVKAGSFVLVPLAYGFLVDPPRMPVTIAPGQAPTVTLRLKATGVIQGAVADAANPGRQVTLERVTLRQDRQNGETRVVTPIAGGGDGLDLADYSRDWVEGGRYSFTNLEAGAHEITLEAAGYEQHTYTQVVTPGLPVPAREVKLEPAQR